MCWKNKTDLIFTEYAYFRLLSGTINDYKGDINDLRGCNNDGRLAKETILGYWPEASTQRLIDSASTVKNFVDVTGSGIKYLKPEAVICVLADSCFSGDITKGLGFITPVEYKRNKFSPTPGVVYNPIPKPLFGFRGDLRWIVMGGCGITGYSADAYINGDYQGAFSYYAFKTLRPGMTYREWYRQIRLYLPSVKFEQMPTLDGPDALLDQVIGANQTLFIHNSTHGTQLNGTEGATTDEAIVFYDRSFRDKEYYNLLNKLAA